MKIMLCLKCQKKESNPETHLSSLCNGCFLEQIEKRVRKELRKSNWIRKNDKVLLIINENKESFVTEYLFNSILKNFPINVEKEKTETIASKLDRYDRIVIPWNMDDEATLFLNEIFENESYDNVPDKVVKLLRNVSDKEVGLFAKLKGFPVEEPIKTNLERAMDKLEKKYPGSKFALIKAKKQLKEL